MKEEKKRMAVEAMGLPKDVLLGDVLVRFVGCSLFPTSAK